MSTDLNLKVFVALNVIFTMFSLNNAATKYLELKKGSVLGSFGSSRGIRRKKQRLIVNRLVCFNSLHFMCILKLLDRTYPFLHQVQMYLKCKAMCQKNYEFSQKYFQICCNETETETNRTYCLE